MGWMIMWCAIGGVVGAAVAIGAQQTAWMVARTWLRNGLAARDAAAAHLEEARAHLGRAQELSERVDGVLAGQIAGLKGIRDIVKVPSPFVKPGHVVYLSDCQPADEQIAKYLRSPIERLDDAILGRSAQDLTREDASGSTGEAPAEQRDGLIGGREAPIAVHRDLWAGDPDATPLGDIREYDRMRKSGELDAYDRRTEALDKAAIEHAHDPNACDVCEADVLGQAIVAEGDPWLGWTGPADPPVLPWCPSCEAHHRANETGHLENCIPGAFTGPAYRTMEEVEAVHGPVVETFEARPAGSIVDLGLDGTPFADPPAVNSMATPSIERTRSAVAQLGKRYPAGADVDIRCADCGKPHFGQCSTLPPGPCGICGWDHHESVCPEQEMKRC